MNLRHVVSLLLTPRASENENRQTKRSPSQEAGTHGKCLAAEVASLLPTPAAAKWPSNQSPTPGASVRPSLHAVNALLGASTDPRSPAGKAPSDAALPGQLTLWDD
jgi:hypothetical protein